MSWEIAAAAVQVGTKLYSMYNEAADRRELANTLDEIKTELTNIRLTLNQIVAQNEAILLALDELPSKLDAIITEAIDEAYLREQYDVILNIERLYVSNSARRLSSAE
ncbi:MAG: hypothetical protein AAGK09_01345 [Planctomycetota bacterium]